MKFICSAYLLIASTVVCATGISTMTQDASLENTEHNWNPAFVDGNTIIVGKDGVNLTGDRPAEVGAIRLDHSVNIFGGHKDGINIGSIAGLHKATMVLQAFNKEKNLWILTGRAGVNDIPSANDYSGISNITFAYKAHLKINAPVTLTARLDPLEYDEGILDINDNVTIGHHSISKFDNSYNIRIASQKSLTLTANNINLITNFNFNDSGILVLSGYNTLFNPSTVSNVQNAILNINNNVTTNTPDVLTIHTINIADGKSLIIDAVNSDINLLENNSTIHVKGSDARLVLTNSGTLARTFTAFNTIIGNILLGSNSRLILHKSLTGNIDFTGEDGILKLASNQTITGNVDSSQTAAGTLEFLGTGTVEGTIGHTNPLSKLKFSGTGDIALLKANAKTIEVAHAEARITSSDKLEGNVLFSNDGTLVADKGVDGIITTNTDNTGTITIGSGDVGVIGSDDKKIKQVNLHQSTDTKIGKLYAHNINITGKGPMLLHDHIHTNIIYIDNSHIGISDNIAIYGNVNASNANILLDNKTLTLHGTHTFVNQIIISSTYDEYNLSGGNIILTSGSTLDLSHVNSLIIKVLCINSDISKISDDTKYSIIITADSSNLIPLNDPEHQIILDSSGEQNKFVKWTIDPQSLTLYASDNSNNVIDQYIFDSQQNNTFMQQLKKTLPSSIAQQFKNNIGLLRDCLEIKV